MGQCWGVLGSKAPFCWEFLTMGLDLAAMWVKTLRTLQLLCKAKAEKGNREQRIAIPHPHRNALCFEGEKPAKLHPFLSKLRQARIDKTVYNPYGTLAHRASQWRPRRTLHQPIPPLWGKRVRTGHLAYQHIPLAEEIHKIQQRENRRNATQ